MKKNKESILPVVGPYGIGKSMTALIIQKNLFLKGIKSLYINIKYYNKRIPFIYKLKTLMNECFYLCSSEEDYISYKKLFEENSYNDIWLYIKDIYEKIIKITGTSFLFIIDQYKQSYDPNENIFKFTKIHIFLLSTINDKDIKSNIKSLLKKENPKLNYIYLKDLIENNIDVFIVNKDRLVKKIIDEKKNLININNDNKNKNNCENNKIDNNSINDNNINNNDDKSKIDIIKTNCNKDKTLNNIFATFGYLPRYISLLLKKYENIFDFSNEEYIKIFRGYF